MSALHSPIGRRLLLASAIVTVAAFLPATAAHAASAPPSAPGAETLASRPAIAPASTAVGESSIIGAAASAVPDGDTSIRPFHYHATDAELADLKRRIKATKW